MPWPATRDDAAHVELVSRVKAAQPLEPGHDRSPRAPLATEGVIARKDVMHVLGELCDDLRPVTATEVFEHRRGTSRHDRVVHALKPTGQNRGSDLNRTAFEPERTRTLGS